VNLISHQLTFSDKHRFEFEIAPRTKVYSPLCSNIYKLKNPRRMNQTQVSPNDDIHTLRLDLIANHFYF